ncbi:unnamed protein product [Polarella glacialis]|uniref:Ankyrin repeat protein n=1 Tax=Polarella glacialis TaxID=89957 RepID=A0A813E785_POLGL|nr:unnamed protein product [Polarella glacialis]
MTDAAARAPLFRAAGKGDVCAVLKALAEGGDVNCCDEDEMSPLMYAAYWSDEPEVCSVLIDAKSDLHSCDKRGMTALMHGAAGCHHKVCELLVEASADINKVESNGRSVLMYATDAASGASAFDSARAREICVLLLERQAEVDIQDSNGCTALLLASIAGSTALLPELLKAGADTTLRDCYGSTAVEYARAEGHESVVQLLTAASKASEALQACLRQQQAYEEALASVEVSGDIAQPGAI